MKIAIVGSRNFKDTRYAYEKLDKLFAYQIAEDLTVVSGGARGIDKLAEEWAENNVLKTKIYEADWDRDGKSAGFMRNARIVNEADMVIAFWDGKSKGTKHSIDLAIKAGKPVDIYVRT